MAVKFKQFIPKSKKKEQPLFHLPLKTSEEKSHNGISLIPTSKILRGKAMTRRMKKRKRKSLKADSPTHSRDAPRSWRE